MDRIWGMMGTQVLCRGVFCRYFIVIFGDISQKAPSFLEIVRLNISESLQTLYIDSHGEARFFEIRKKSAMTVALSPKKTITY